MSEQGAALQTYNQELVKVIEGVRVQNKVLSALILDHEKEKSELDKELEEVKGKVASIERNLKELRAKKEDSDRLLDMTESAYMKIIESSQALLNLVQQHHYHSGETPKVE